MNAADKEQVKEAEGKEKRGRERELLDILSIMDTVQGRRYMLKLLDFCGVYQANLAVDNKVYYNEGKRNVGLMLLADINEASPDLYVKMMKEKEK